MSACKYRVSGSLSLPSRGSFHRSFTVLFSIGHQVVFRLGGWSPRLPTGLLVSDGTPDTAHLTAISPTGFSPSLICLPKQFGYHSFRFWQSSTPKTLLPSVWPLSISLAATLKIDVSFSSSAYLDVSVQRVSLRTAMCSPHGDWVLPNRVAPFGNPRVAGYLLLSAAYRSLSRPSSAPDAKASSLYSS